MFEICLSLVLGTFLVRKRSKTEISRSFWIIAIFLMMFLVQVLVIFASFRVVALYIYSSIQQANFFLVWPVIRAQEPKAPVTYCDLLTRCPVSVVCPSVRQFTFSTSSPEPLDRFWWNLVWRKYSRSLTSVVVFRPDPPRGGATAGQK